jgi:hypothetical protein
LASVQAERRIAVADHRAEIVSSGAKRVKGHKIAEQRRQTPLNFRLPVR